MQKGATNVHGKYTRGAPRNHEKKKIKKFLQVLKIKNRLVAI